LIDLQKLHFVSIAELKRTCDGFESFVSDDLDRAFKELLPIEVQAKIRESKPIVMFDNHRLVNCWHANSCEATDMWAEYGDAGRGVAIKSSVARFKESIASVEHAIYLSNITYFDPQSEAVQPSNITRRILELPMHKAAFHKHENEIRALCADPEGNLPRENRSSPVGSFIAVDLHALVECVVVGPNSPGFLPELICSMLERYNMQFRVIPSQLRRR
jgi:hypothetical protein